MVKLYLPAGFGMPGMYAINTMNGMALAGQIGYQVGTNVGTHAAFAPRTVGMLLLFINDWQPNRIFSSG